MALIYFKIAARDWLFDEKLNNLGLEYKGAWANLLAFAKICNMNGQFIDEVDEPFSVDQIIKKARISAIHFRKFEACNMVERLSTPKGLCYSIKNWLKFQPEYDRTKPYKKSYKDLKIKQGEGEREGEGANLHPGVENLHPNKSKYSNKVIKASDKQDVEKLQPISNNGKNSHKQPITDFGF